MKKEEIYKLKIQLRFAFVEKYREDLKDILRAEGINPDGICVYEREVKKNNVAINSGKI